MAVTVAIGNRSLESMRLAVSQSKEEDVRYLLEQVILPAAVMGNGGRQLRDGPK